MAASGRHRLTRKRFTAGVVALAAVGGAVAYTVASPAEHASAAGGCAPYESIRMGKYWINNNTWGAKNGKGWSCSWDAYLSGSTIGWGTNYEWSGDPNAVKSYASSVLGWHWGWKVPQSELPVRVADHKPVRTAWSYKVKESKESVYNVAYDLWLHDSGRTDWQSKPKHEVMVWLAKDGGAGPLGTKRERMRVGGAAWDLYVGDIGWNVYSFVRVGNTSSANLNLDDFLQVLVQRGLVARTDYLSGIEAGTEVFTGKAQLDTTAYSVNVG
ncbi:GH12 family glycosyl hydrolase domain-containing protein [Streptomyces sp. H34-S4]|uniref:GH12 family glycosyl hydrolase domain-containing protein n=1 Tax=Streptomyces sp. H34-S4 TaxID=2996463 RepID=UPI00226FDAD4|nr:endo-1,4-beta-glucanase [Streptomyces sp. H34-S4]MCY0936071.1 endo-1,4-beta-glucanase [Streptomyces sp. H34-S4]